MEFGALVYNIIVAAPSMIRMTSSSHKHFSKVIVYSI